MKILVKMAIGIVTKPPKPGFVGFGSTYLGEAAFIGGNIFLRLALIITAEFKGGIPPPATSRLSLERVFFIANLFVPRLYAEVGNNHGNTMVYMALVIAMVN